MIPFAFPEGVAMLLAGDEMGRTQEGNNNAYCQDNGISWEMTQGYWLLAINRAEQYDLMFPKFCYCAVY